MLTVEDEDGDRDERISRQTPRYGMPVSVLVDEDTASAAELFASILQHHGRARVVGESTFGKHSVQRFNPLPRQGQAELCTVARCWLPNGSPAAPAIPDVCGDLTEAIGAVADRRVPEPAPHRTAP